MYLAIYLFFKIIILVVMMVEFGYYIKRLYYSNPIKVTDLYSSSEQDGYFDVGVSGYSSVTISVTSLPVLNKYMRLEIQYFGDDE